MKLLRLSLLSLAAFVSASSLRADLRPAIKPDLPRIPEKTFKVRDHGAKGDGRADDTRAFQATIDAARKAGGGTVEISAGVYLSGPLHLASDLDLPLAAGATLAMLPLGEYPGDTQRGGDFSAAPTSTTSPSPAPARSMVRARPAGRSRKRPAPNARGCSSSAAASASSSRASP